MIIFFMSFVWNIIPWLVTSLHDDRRDFDVRIFESFFFYVWSVIPRTSSLYRWRIGSFLRTLIHTKYLNYYIFIYSTIILIFELFHTLFHNKIFQLFIYDKRNPSHVISNTHDEREFFLDSLCERVPRNNGGLIDDPFDIQTEFFYISLKTGS